MTTVRDPFRRAQVAIAALFCLLGFQYATWVSRLPALKAELGLDEAEIGLMLMVCGVGAAVSFPLVAHLMRRLGSRRLAALSALGLVVVLLALAAVPSYPLALVVLFCDGVAVGCLNVAMNAQGAALEARFERTTMSRLHATFSAGSLLAALLASGVNVVTTGLGAHFATAAVLLLLLVALAWPGTLADDRPATAAEGTAPDEGTRKRRGLPLPSRVTVWMGLAMVFGTVTEGAMNDWSTLYMKDVAGAGPEIAPLGIAVVSTMMVLARIFADGWRARWGDGRIVVAGSALAATGLALALLAGGVLPALLGFACVGLGTAAVTPCVYVAAARQGSDALALVAATGTTGLLAGPAVIGFVAHGSSLVWGMAAVAASAALVSACGTRIRWTAAPEAAPAATTPTAASAEA